MKQKTQSNSKSWFGMDERGLIGMTAIILAVVLMFFVAGAYFWWKTMSDSPGETEIIRDIPQDAANQK